MVSGKNRRITFQECPDDLCGMVDLAKVADLVLLVVDGRYNLLFKLDNSSRREGGGGGRSAVGGR